MYIVRMGLICDFGISLTLKTYLFKDLYKANIIMIPKRVGSSGLRFGWRRIDVYVGLWRC